MKKTSKRIVHNLWLFLLLISYLLFSYYYFGGWWNSALGTGLILFFSFLIWKNDFLTVTGTRINRKIILKTVALVLLFTAASYFIMLYLGHKHNSAFQFTNWKNYFHNIFYILNEEIIMGSLILYFLVQKRKLSPILASVLLAIGFSIVHFIFYRWIFTESGIIEVSTLITLFLVGFVRNNLILQTKHIGYSWALHFSWMTMMFGNHHYHTNTNERLTEPERFNLFLGSAEMLTTAAVLAIISFVFFMKNKKHQ